MAVERDEEGCSATTTIQTERLVLRMPDARERAALALLAASPRVAANLIVGPFAGAVGQRREFALVERSGGAIVGGAAYWPVADRRAAVELAGYLGEDHWGRGYGTEAMQALIDRAFADGDVSVVLCSNRASNTRARRVIEKCGFQFRGTGMARAPAPQGAVPVECFLLGRRNWESLKAWGAGSKPGRNADVSRGHAA